MIIAMIEGVLGFATCAGALRIVLDTRGGNGHNYNRTGLSLCILAQVFTAAMQRNKFLSSGTEQYKAPARS